MGIDSIVNCEDAINWEWIAVEWRCNQFGKCNFAEMAALWWSNDIVVRQFGRGFTFSSAHFFTSADLELLKSQIWPNFCRCSRFSLSLSSSPSDPHKTLLYPYGRFVSTPIKKQCARKLKLSTKSEKFTRKKSPAALVSRISRWPFEAWATPRPL